MFVLWVLWAYSVKLNVSRLELVGFRFVALGCVLLEVCELRICKQIL